MIRRLVLALAAVAPLSAAPLSAVAAPEGHDRPGHGGAVGFGHAATPEVAARVVRVTMGDLSFSPDRLTVKRGETIRFVLRNDSAIDHDFTLGDAATQAMHRRDMAAGHMHGAHHDAANAVMVAAGGQAELAWTFDQPGVVEFDCNVPGHFEAGMRGEVTVQ